MVIVVVFGVVCLFELRNSEPAGVARQPEHATVRAKSYRAFRDARSLTIMHSHTTFAPSPWWAIGKRAKEQSESFFFLCQSRREDSTRIDSEWGVTNPGVAA